MPLKAGVSIVVVSLGLSLSVRADTDPHRVRDAGPEDGILCCNGRIPFLFDGDQVLTTAGRAGIFRSEHRGAHWDRSMQGLVAPNGVSPQLVSVCQAPSEPRIVYALAGLEVDVSPFNGLFSSDNFGATWTRRASVPTGGGFAVCGVDPDDPRTVYVSGIFFNSENPWKSSDGGQTVQRIEVGIPSFASALVHPVRGVLYVETFEAVYASTDGGVSFQALRLPPGLVGTFHAALDGHALFLTTLDPGTFRTIGFFRSTDGGKSFAPVAGLRGGIASLAVDPTDSRRIYAMSDGLPYVSTDGGATFDQLPKSNDPRFFGPDLVAIGVDPRGSVYLSTRGGLFRTDDGGEAFRPVVDGFRASAVNDLAFDARGRLLVGVTNTQVIFRQTQGRSFRALGAPLIADGFLVHAASVAGAPSDPDVIVVATFDEGIYRTEDSGRNWTPAAVSGNRTAFHNSRMVFATASRLYLAGPTPSAPGLYRSDDAGRSFARLSSLPFGAVAVDPIDADTIYVGTYGSDDGLFQSTDGGQTLWNLGQRGSFSALAIDRRNRQVIYAGERFGQVMRSLDGGRTFAPARAGLSGNGVHGFAQDHDGTLFVWLRGGGLFSSQDGASRWHPVDTGEALRRSGVEAGRGAITVDPNHRGRVYLGNAGVLEYRTGKKDTSK